ncbi:hypothetical protein ACJMK2_006542 [Sinanodonta woodiana]|uniref:Uncharacterized protein n=1 Tax=Sinanodonta woodiana TaxID=1069815 RepID=A0ABD3VWY0_SINWO
MPRLKRNGVICSAKLLIIIICFICFWNQLFSRNALENDTIEIPEVEKLDMDGFAPLGINAVEEYVFANLPPKIPRIIHQTWIDRAVPINVVAWMKSWSIYHPTWKYVYWTDKTARCLIKDRHMNFLHIYDAYLENIRRADAMRYIILYEFGGVYADMDMESLRSLDVIIEKYSCILAQEPYEHPIMDGNFNYLVINAFIACSKKHPFMKLVIDQLAYFNHFWNVLDSTGPHFLTYVYKRYRPQQIENITNNDIFLAPAEYFFPTIDPAKFSYMMELCKKFLNLNYLRQQACVSLKTMGLQREPYIFSFTIHHWIHTYFSSGFRFVETHDIFEVIPGAKMYDCIEGIHI